MMRDLWKSLAIVCMAGWLVGCRLEVRNVEAYAAKPIPLSAALAGLQSDLKAAGPVILSDVNGPPDRLKTIITAIGAAQCINGTSNPVIMVVSGPVQLSLQGQISESGQFTVSATPGGQVTVTRQAAQQVTFPMALVSIANLPDFYLGQQLATVQYLSLANNDAQKLKVTAAVDRALSAREALWNIVQRQVAAYPSYTKDQCAEFISAAGRGGIASLATQIFLPPPP